jgi:hypothetical protein
MNEIIPFINELEEILHISAKDFSAVKDNVIQLLDGRPSYEMRRLVPLKELKQDGIFFTGSKLAQLALSLDFISSINSSSVIVDPACGGGDLLLACTNYLPLDQDLEKTIAQWQQRIFGVDIHHELLEIAKRRVILKAISLGSKTNKKAISQLQSRLTGFRVGSIFNNTDVIQNATHIIMNPPFCTTPSPDSCQWASGKVNAAALFVETCIENAHKGTRILAILPDVLRSGSRYEKWRKYVESKCEILNVQIYGRFDKWVDVFILELNVNDEIKFHKVKWDANNNILNGTIADKFNISIGSVVEFRDPLTGPNLQLIRPLNLPTWTLVNEVSDYRLYNGKTVSSPFVVVRRTSRQGDNNRANATIINIEEDVAVENHLIVLEPNDGNLSTCQELINNLQDRRTNEWLNQAICCRHLTKKSLASVPWWSNL